MLAAHGCLGIAGLSKQVLVDVGLLGCLFVSEL
jgi:hypothetical protein